jgi:hypothetical protein
MKPKYSVAYADLLRRTNQEPQLPGLNRDWWSVELVGLAGVLTSWKSWKMNLTDSTNDQVRHDYRRLQSISLSPSLIYSVESSGLFIPRRGDYVGRLDLGQSLIH